MKSPGKLSGGSFQGFVETVLLVLPHPPPAEHLACGHVITRSPRAVHIKIQINSSCVYLPLCAVFLFRWFCTRLEDGGASIQPLVSAFMLRMVGPLKTYDFQFNSKSFCASKFIVFD